MSFDRAAFESTKRTNAEAQNNDERLQRLTREFIIESDRYGYTYQWTWLGMPIVQMPQDILVTQEIIWHTKPDLIIETGVAWGGSIVLYASLLQLIGKGRVIGIDTVLPEKNQREIMKFPFSNRISLYEGSSTDPDVFRKVVSKIKSGDKVMVALDSNHTHDHVLEELRLYGRLVSQGQYMVVSDTIVDDIPYQAHRPRPWGPGNNPKTAVKAFLNEESGFGVDTAIGDRLLITYSRDGYLKRLR